ncbi:unnamed protein product [Paramecium primaurelia]|uniref:Uncharacterized protein n=1 Tax=Paramecium primaurelia TaxID=5886 RepID=A0A8S1QHQ8_PARPR|nr:unnamed protein product [Paramecium primaurelia]
MLDSEPRGRLSFGGKIDKCRNVKFSLIFKENDNSTIYLLLINKTLNEEVFTIQEMKKEIELYTIELSLKENCIYKYYYEALDNRTQQKDIELQCRYFQFAETEKMLIDQWNKFWCLYRIRPKTDEIFQAYQLSIKNCQNEEYFELKKSAILFPAKDYYELIDNDMTQQIRQFSLRSQKDQTEDLSCQIHIQNINKFKMNSFYVEFDLQLFQKQKAEEIKNYLQIFETNQEWNYMDQIKILKQQVEEANKKVLELEQEKRELSNNLKIKEQDLIDQLTLNQKQKKSHKKEIENIINQNLSEKYNLSNIHYNEIKYLTEDFDKKIKYLSEQAIIQNQQYLLIQEDFNQFQKNASKKINDYIDKLQESQNKIQIQELQLIQLKNNNTNNVDNDHQFNQQVVISLCDIDQKASKEEIAQMNSLKEKLKQYEQKQHELIIKNQEIELEIVKNDRLKSAFMSKINNYIEQQDICIQNLENTKKELQDYIQKNQILEQTTQQQAEHNQKLQKLLEIVKKKYKELQTYKEQYQELLQKYEYQMEQFKQLEQQKKLDDDEFEKFKEEKSQQINSIVNDYQQSIKQYQNENQILLEKQKAEQLQKLQQQQQLFLQCSQEILDNIFTEILSPYQIHQERFQRKLSCNLDSEIRNIKYLMLINFETAINFAADGINIITNNSFNDLKEDLISIHTQIIDQIHKYKENIDQSTMKGLLSLMNEFQKKLLEIKDFAYQVEDMLEQDQNQIDLINNNCQTLEKILDIVLKLNSILERKNDELTILLQNQDGINQTFEHYRQRTLSLINTNVITIGLESL